MTYDPLKRDSSWTMYQPGCWIDPAGHGHIFPDEVLAELQRQFPEMGFDPCSREDYDIVIRGFKQAMEEQHLEATFTIAKHEREAS